MCAGTEVSSNSNSGAPGLYDRPNRMSGGRTVLATPYPNVELPGASQVLVSTGESFRISNIISSRVGSSVLTYAYDPRTVMPVTVLPTLYPLSHVGCSGSCTSTTLNSFPAIVF